MRVRCGHGFRGARSCFTEAKRSLAPPSDANRHPRRRSEIIEDWAPRHRPNRPRPSKPKGFSSQAPSTIDERSAGAAHPPSTANDARNTFLTERTEHLWPDPRTTRLDPRPAAMPPRGCRSTSMASAIEDSQTRVRDLREEILPTRLRTSRKKRRSNTTFSRTHKPKRRPHRQTQAIPATYERCPQDPGSVREPTAPTNRFESTIDYAFDFPCTKRALHRKHERSRALAGAGCSQQSIILCHTFDTKPGFGCWGASRGAS